MVVTQNVMISRLLEALFVYQESIICGNLCNGGFDSFSDVPSVKSRARMCTGKDSESILKMSHSCKIAETISRNQSATPTFRNIELSGLQIVLVGDLIGAGWEFESALHSSWVLS